MEGRKEGRKEGRSKGLKIKDEKKEPKNPKDPKKLEQFFLKDRISKEAGIEASAKALRDVCVRSLVWRLMGTEATGGASTRPWLATESWSFEELLVRVLDTSN